jgi:hypothetical protein
LLQVIFWHGHHKFLYVFAALYLYLPLEGDGKLVCMNVWGYVALKALLKGALGQQAACQL